MQVTDFLKHLFSTNTQFCQVSLAKEFVIEGAMYFRSNVRKGCLYSMLLIIFSRMITNKNSGFIILDVSFQKASKIAFVRG